MKKFVVLSALISLPLAGCQRRDTHELKERIIALENKVSDLEEKVSSGVTAGSPDEARKQQLEKLISAFTKLEEKSYVDDPKAKAGEGSLEVIVTTREGPAYMQARTKPEEADGVDGVTVRVAETTLPTVKTKAKGPVHIGALKAGNYTVEFEKAGYQKKLFPVEIKEGKRKTLVTFLLKEGEEAGASLGSALQGLAGQGGEAGAEGGAAPGAGSDQAREFLSRLQGAMQKAKENK